MAAQVGLTGGIGSGKSSVADRFAALGVPVISADEIARDLTRPGTDIWRKIKHRFGPGILDAKRELRRARLREYAFTDPKIQHYLEALLHPPIRAQMTAKADTCPAPYCILEIPLLVENLRHWPVDRVLMVFAPQTIRLRRLYEKGVPRRMARAIMQTQVSDSQRRLAADDVIFNDEDLAALEKQVEVLAEKYRRVFLINN